MSKGNLEIVEVNVDHEKCTGTGACISRYPQMFQYTDEEQEKAVTQMKEGWDDERLMEAARACPKRAITLINEKRWQVYPSF